MTMGVRLVRKYRFMRSSPRRARHRRPSGGSFFCRRTSSPRGAAGGAGAPLPPARREASRGGDALVVDDDRAVVEGRAGIEERFQQLAGEDGVDAAAMLDVLAQADVALDGDERADAVLGELDGGVGELVDDAGGLAPQERGEKTGLGEMGEAAAQLGREQEDGGDRGPPEDPGE